MRRTSSWMKLAPTLALLVLAPRCIEETAGRTALPLEPSAVGPSAAASLRALASAWSEASAWMDEAPIAGWLGDLAEDAAGQSAEPVSPGEPIDPVDDPVDPDAPPTLAELADALADRVEDEIFVPANLEAQDATSATYRVPASVVCPEDEAGQLDAGCVARFEAEPLRVRVASYAAGELELTPLVGAGHTPVTIVLSQARVALTLDLAELAATFPPELADEDVVIDHASGRLTIALERRAPRAVRLSVGVSSALDIDATLAGHAVSLALGRSTATLDLDADAQRMTLDDALGALSLSLPYQLLAELVAGDEEPARVIGTLALDLAGHSARIVLDEGDDALALEGLGFGARRSTITLDGQPVVALDLNAGRGRTVDVALQRMADDTTRITFTPGLEVVLELDLARLAALDGELATSWLGDETLGLALDGALDPTLVVGHALGVERGRLALVSTARPELSLEVQAGQCLVRDEEASDGASPHPFAGLTVEACQ